MKANLQFSIEPAEGLGDIKFGFTTEDVQRYLGPPDETEIVGPTAALWYYARVRLQLIFQSDFFESAATIGEPMRITQFVTSSPAVTLAGMNIIGKTEIEVLKFLSERGYEGFVQWDISPVLEGYKTLRLEGMRIGLNFQDGLLNSMLWGAVRKVVP
jgi:hypothetical protein